MEASLNEEGISRRVAAAVGDDRRFLKHVHDNVHGNIYLDPVMYLVLVSVFSFSFCRLVFEMYFDLCFSVVECN